MLKYLMYLIIFLAFFAIYFYITKTKNHRKNIQNLIKKHPNFGAKIVLGKDFPRLGGAALDPNNKKILLFYGYEDNDKPIFSNIIPYSSLSSVKLFINGLPSEINEINNTNIANITNVTLSLILNDENYSSHDIVFHSSYIPAFKFTSKKILNEAATWYEIMTICIAKKALFKSDYQKSSS